MSSPLAHKTNVDTNINVKNRTRRRAINLRGFSFAQHPISKFRGQGDTHRVKMKSKASSQTTNAVVAEWKTACDKARSCKLYKLSNKRLNTDGSGCTVTQSGNAIQDRTTQKNTQDDPQIPHPDLRFASQTKAKQQQNGARAQPKQKSPEKTQEKHAGCQYSSMLCFHMYKPRTNSEYASNQTVYNGRNTSSGKALACWFFICTNLKQTLFKPQIYGAGPCQQVRRILKENSINFFFCARQL